MSIIPGIYCIKSISHPERFYLGSSNNIIKRWGNHVFLLKKGVHHSKKLQHHYNKYGIDDLDFWIYEICVNNENLIDREQFYLDVLKPWFNICKIADRPTGVKRSKEHMAKLIEGIKNHVYTDEERRLRGLINKGKTVPQEMRDRISLKLKGRVLHKAGWKHTKESLEKMSKAKMGKKRPPVKEETKEKLRQSQIAYLSIKENKDARTAAANKAWEDKRNGVFIKTRINGRKPKNKAIESSI